MCNLYELFQGKKNYSHYFSFLKDALQGYTLPLVSTGNASSTSGRMKAGKSLCGELFYCTAKQLVFHLIIVAIH